MATGTQGSGMLEGRARTWSIVALAVLCLGLILYLFRPFAPRHPPRAPHPQARAPEPQEEPMSPEARTRMRGVTTMVPFFLSPYAGGGQ